MFPARNAMPRRSKGRSQNAVSRATEVLRVLLPQRDLHPVHHVRVDLAALVIDFYIAIPNLIMEASCSG